MLIVIFLLLIFMCHRGCFREDIFEICILCKKENSGIKHVVNECILTKAQIFIFINIFEINKILSFLIYIKSK